jgi:hypothetical protein
MRAPGIGRRTALALGGAMASTTVLAPFARAGDGPPGTSYDYDWDGKDIGHPELAWQGRAYVPPTTAGSMAGSSGVPLLVFLHGLNAALIPHRWMGGGREGDVRRIAGRLVDEGKVAPMVIAGPSSVVRSQVAKGASWNRFDLDRFIDRTAERLSDVVKLDESRIVVAGHSGAGCSTLGGLATLDKSKRKLHAILSIDTCMAPAIAQRLARHAATTHVVVTYQRLSWGKRPFALFERTFHREVEAHPAAPSVERAVVELEPKSAPHNRCVPLTLERWLPKLLPPPL